MGRAARRARGATIELNKAHWPVTVLGPGRRIGIWVQGCSIHCPGCVSQDTWPRDAAKAIAVRDLLGWCRKVSANAPDGVTISGGEPFEQPRALLALLDGLSAWRAGANLDFDILCYSGMPLRRLEKDHARLLARLDAVIPEPFVDGLPKATYGEARATSRWSRSRRAATRATQRTSMKPRTHTASACRRRSRASACG